MSWFGVLPFAVPTADEVEALSVFVYGRGGTLSPFLTGPSALSRELTETSHVSDGTVTRTWDGSGMTSFIASTGHATVIDYTAELYDDTTSLIASENLFKPTPDANFVITVDLSALFAYWPAGNYTVVIVARDAGGSTPSEPSNPFTLPLPWWPTERVAVQDTVTVVRI